MPATNPYVTALDAEAAGDWEKAHQLVQDLDTPEAAWVHAYLHRVEGDPGNAAYWYRLAGQPVASGNFVKEREAIRKELEALS